MTLFNQTDVRSGYFINRLRQRANEYILLIEIVMVFDRYVNLGWSDVLSITCGYSID